jgi:hypothetical protein
MLRDWLPHDWALVNFKCALCPERLRRTPTEDVELALRRGPRGTLQTVSAVYVVGNAANSLLKIGYADNLKHRMSGLNTGSPVDLQLLHFLYFVDCMVAGMVETAVHKELAEYRRRGEWFEVTMEQAGEAIANAVTSRRLKWFTEAERHEVSKFATECRAKHEERQRIFGT